MKQTRLENEVRERDKRIKTLEDEVQFINGKISRMQIEEENNSNANAHAYEQKQKKQIAELENQLEAQKRVNREHLNKVEDDTIKLKKLEQAFDQSKRDQERLRFEL